MGEFCNFTINYTCELNGTYKLITVEENNIKKIYKCGEKIDSRKALSPKTPNNPNRKPLCDINIIEPKNLNDQEFLKNL